MAFTQFRKLSAQAYNSANNTWGANGTTGVDLNTGLISLVDYAMGGISTFTNPSGAISLSFTAGGGGDVQNSTFRFTGTITADTTVTTAAGDATTYFNGLYAWSNTTTGSFTLTLTTANGSLVLPQGRRGILYVNNVNSIAPFIVAMVGSATADPIPTGTVMLFYQNAAPSGWTIVSSQNNKALRVVSSAGGVAGGTTAFTSVFTSRIPAGTNASSSVPVATTTDWGTQAGTTAGRMRTLATGETGSGLAVANNTVTLTAAAQGFTGTAMDFAVQYIDVILCQRD